MRRLSIAGLALVVIGALLVTGIYTSQTAFAGGGVGGGGSGGGGTNDGYGWTTYGHGWAEYNTSGNGPTAGFNSGNWTTIKGICQSANAQKVDIYILGTGVAPGNAGYPSWNGKYMGYNDRGYSGMWGGGGSVDSSRATKISRTTAQNRFNNLGSYGVSTSGYTWGSNVAWFCWDFQNEWYITPNTSMGGGAHPRPGDVVTWDHNAHQDGPNDTDKTVKLYRQRNVNSAGWSNINNWSKGSGWNNGTNFGVHSGTWTPAQNDDGKRVCERAVVDPRAWNNNSSLAAGADCATAWQKWQVSSATAESHTGVSPGQTITWTHTLTNSGPDWTSATVSWNVTHTPATPSTEVPYNSGTIGQDWQDGAANKKTYVNTYTIKSTDAGKNLCQGLSASPSQRLTWDVSPSGTATSGSKCVTIPYNYVLTPSITTNPSTPSEVSTPLDINPSVNNSGPTVSENVQWEVHRFIYNPGSNPNTTGGNSTNAACAYFTAPAPSSCTLVPGSNGSGSKVFPTGNSQPNGSQLTENIPALDPGARVCYVLSVKPWKNQPGVSGGTDWRHSNMICVIVAKKPKLHIEDGDLKVRGDIVTSTSTISGNTYGSWVDYGAFSVGKNGDTAYGNAIASGAGLRDGLASGLGSAWSKLTFANTLAPPTNTLGQFTLGTFSSSHDYFMNQKNTTGATLPMTGTGVKVINAGANPTIGATTVNVGSTFIIKATGTVTINGNITYDTTTPITALKDIPQVIIVADNINIRQSVTRVDAWLLATGTINTCPSPDHTVGAPLTASTCNTSLVVNGPISANKLYVYRTQGATKTNPEEPAETFRITPTTYLWVFNYTNQADRVRTTYVTEEPPRF